MSDERTETAVAKRDNDQALDVQRKLHDPEYVQLLKDSYCQGATDQEFALAVETARHLNLDPVAKQIYFIKRWDGGLRRETVSTQVSIDGLRLVAERTGKYLGQTETQWCGHDGVWTDAWLGNGPPAAARVGVLRSDFAQPMYAVARYASYVQTKKGGEPNSMWQKFPDVMIAKCAEALALRRAFPSEMSGVYTTDEMGQADNAPAHSNAHQMPAVTGRPGLTYEGLIQGLAAASTLDDLGELAKGVGSLRLQGEQLATARAVYTATNERIKSARIVEAEARRAVAMAAAAAETAPTEEPAPPDEPPPDAQEPGPMEWAGPPPSEDFGFGGGQQ